MTRRSRRPLPFFYVPFDQVVRAGLKLRRTLRKTSGDPMLLAPVLQREALALNPDAVFNTSRMEGRDGLVAIRPESRGQPVECGGVGVPDAGGDRALRCHELRGEPADPRTRGSGWRWAQTRRTCSRL